MPLWASGFIVGKIATGHMPVPTVLLWRLAIGLAVMSAVVAVVRPGRPRGRAWLHLAVTALLLQVGQFSFVYTGLSHGVPAGLTSLILAWPRCWSGCSRRWCWPPGSVSRRCWAC